MINSGSRKRALGWERGAEKHEVGTTAFLMLEM